MSTAAAALLQYRTWLVALTLFAEAAGEPIEGKLAVASVIWWRANGDPAQLERVIRAPRQFSCWNRGTPPEPPPDEPSQRAWRHCKDIATNLAQGNFAPQLFADHYHATTLTPSPTWARQMQHVATIGGHAFYWEGRKPKPTNRKVNQ